MVAIAYHQAVVEDGKSHRNERHQALASNPLKRRGIELVDNTRPLPSSPAVAGVGG